MKPTIDDLMEQPTATISIASDGPKDVATLAKEAVMNVMANSQPGLLTYSPGFKPFRYGWAYDMWKRHEKVHWLAEEVPLGDDIRDWNTRINVSGKNLLTQVFRQFTESDSVVGDNYMENLATTFKPTEVKMMLAGFAAREMIHMDAYALTLETVGMPESEYRAFLEYSEMKDKFDFLQGFKMDTPADVLRTLAVFGAFVEGLQLFAQFAMLMNFPRHGLMKGMGQIVSWSVRDESMHCEGIIKLFHEYARETGALTPELKQELRDICATIIKQEDRFIDLAFELGPVQGMTADDIKCYIRFIADWRLRQLGLEEMFHVSVNPLPWLQPLLSAQEHANFFEARATEYSKGSSGGSWQDVWAGFDTIHGVP